MKNLTAERKNGRSHAAHHEDEEKRSRLKDLNRKTSTQRDQSKESMDRTKATNETPQLSQ